MSHRWVWTMFAVVLSCALQAQGQTSTNKGQPSPNQSVLIRGVVRENAGNAGVAHVRVMLESVHFGTSFETSTDDGGRFEFRGIGHGIYFVRIRATGYVGADEVTRSCGSSACRRVDLTVGTSEFLNFLLDRLPNAVPNVPPKGPGAVLDAQDAAVPEQARKEYEAGVKALEAGNADLGVSYLKKAIATHPTFAVAYFRLGTTYADQRQWQEAIQALQKATSLNSRLAPAQLALGSVYLEQRDFAAAEVPLRKTIELNPQTPFGHFGLARVELALNRLDDAEMQARKALELKPDFASAYVLLGNVYLRRKDTESARKAYEEYLRLDPNGAMVSETRSAIARLERHERRPD